MTDYSDSDDYNAEEKPDEAMRLAQLASFAAALVVKRQAAVDGRKLSGIESIWRDDDEYYDGIDEVNRADSMLKPSTMDGRMSSRGNGIDPSKSSVFVNITQPYVDMSSSRIADMALPTNDKPFSIRPTPVPEIAESVDNDTEMMPGGQHTVGEASSAFIAEMDAKSKKAETQIWDWLCESRWHGEVRRVIEQAARIGSGCLKGPTPVKRRKRKMSKVDGIISLTIADELKPSSKAIDVWNIYPDPSCGESIHNGSYIFEKDFISAKQLIDLKGSGHMDAEIDAVLKEGPGKRNMDERNRAKEAENYEIWYYYGIATSDDLTASGCECEEGRSIPVVVVMVNDRIIKASMSILDSGEFPYDIMVWQRRTGTWAGKGVARQVRTAQRMINAAARNLLDNAGVSAGPQIIIRDGVIYPADGLWSITPMKIWRVDENADINDVNHAITSIIIPSMQAELENIIKMAMEIAEKATSMPLMMQGQQGTATPTVGGMTILQNNSNTVQRRIAKIYDDDLVEPHILRYYEYMMLHGDDDEMKGDYSVQALGSSALYERDAQNQMIMQLIPMVANPAFGINPDLLITEILKMNKISPERIRYTEEEREEMQKAMQENAPIDPRAAGAKEVAEIKVQGDTEKAKIVQASDMAEIEAKNKGMKAEFALKLQLANAEHEHKERMLQMQLDIKMMELSQSQQLSLDSIKATLASDTMKLKTQKELSMLGNAAKQVAMPETEPVGQAQPGHAFEQ